MQSIGPKGERQGWLRHRRNNLPDSCDIPSFHGHKKGAVKGRLLHSINHLVDLYNLTGVGRTHSFHHIAVGQYH